MSSWQDAVEPSCVVEEVEDEQQIDDVAAPSLGTSRVRQPEDDNDTPPCGDEGSAQHGCSGSSDCVDAGMEAQRVTAEFPSSSTSKDEMAPQASSCSDQPPQQTDDNGSGCEVSATATASSSLAESEQLKAEGNRLYAAGDYDNALQCYWQALDAAPPEAEQRAVYYANASACYIKRGDWQLAVEQCTQALRIDEAYVKALQRRSMALRELDDLEHALTDARKARTVSLCGCLCVCLYVSVGACSALSGHSLLLDPFSAPTCTPIHHILAVNWPHITTTPCCHQVLELTPGDAWAVRTVEELEPVVAERQEKLKEEMLGKLKDLGNSLLGKFGLSLDNFKADKDPETGGYSIRFSQ